MTPPQSPARKNPYIGPRSFRRDAEEAKLFFGREEEARQLSVRVQTERLTLFYAESGAGKSSLLNARLIPGLEERGYVVLPVGRVSGTPHAHLMAEIDNIFAFNLMDQIDENDSTPQRYAKATLSDFLKRLVSNDGVHFRYDPDLKPPPVRPEEAVPYVLIIDQFEEILTTHPGRWLDRENFFRQLDQAMRDDPNLWVVLSLREDFVARIEPYAPLLADRMRGRFYMQRMQEQQALDAVRLPAQQFGRPFAPEAAQALVDNLRQVRVAGEETAAGQYVEPVQLQVVCLQLWEGLTPSAGHNITLADLERLAGGRSLAEFVDQALMDFYTRSLAEVLADLAVKALPDVSEAGLRRFFSQQLITELGTRGFVLQGENQTGGLPNLVLRLLRDRYLLRAENRAGGLWYELIHDRFVEPIQRTNREWFAQNQNPLTRAAQAWEAAGRSPDKFLAGAALSEAEAQLAANPATYGPLERTFVTTSAEAARKAAARRQQRVTLGAVVLVVLFAILAAWGLLNSNKATANANLAVIAKNEAKNSEATAVAEATRALIAEATAQRDRRLALEAKATSEISEKSARSAEATAVFAQSSAENARKLAEHLSDTFRRRVRAEQLSLEAKNALESGNNVPRSILLAIEAIQSTQDFDEPNSLNAIQMLRDAISAGRGLVLHNVERPIKDLMESPNGKWLVTDQDGEDSVKMWHLPQKHVLSQSQGVPGEWMLASENGRWLITIQDSPVQYNLWDLNMLEPWKSPVVINERPIAFSDDSRWLVAAYTDTVAISALYDLKDIAYVPTRIEGNPLIFSPDSKWLLMLTENEDSLLWHLGDSENGQKKQVIEGFPYGFNAQGSWFASLVNGHTTTLWRLSQDGLFEQERVVKGIPSSIPSASGWSGQPSQPDELTIIQGSSFVSAFSTGGHWLLTVADSQSLLWNLARSVDESAVVLLSGQPFAFSSNEEWLVMLNEDDTASLWDLRIPEPISYGLVGVPVGFVMNSKYFVTTANDLSSIQVFDLKLANPSLAPILLDGPGRDSSSNVLFSKNQRWLIMSGRWDPLTYVWDMSTFETNKVPLQLRGNEWGISEVTLSNNSEWLALMGGNFGTDTTLRLWNLEYPLQLGEPVSFSGPVGQWGQSFIGPNNRWLLTPGGFRQSALLWDLSKRPINFKLWGDTDQTIAGAAFSLQGEWLIIESDSHSLTLWNLAEDEPKPIPLQPIDLLDQIAQIKLQTGSQEWITTPTRGNSILSYLISPTAENSQVINEIPPEIHAYFGDDPGLILFSPNTQWYAVLNHSRDPFAYLWRSNDLSVAPLILAGHEGGLLDMTMSADGRWLATGDRDSTARLWDMSLANPSEESIVIREHGNVLSTVAFSPDSRQLLTIASNGTDASLQLAYLNAEDLIGIGCMTAGRNMTLNEWNQFFFGIPYRTTCPEFSAHRSLLDEAKNLLKKGDVDKAIASVTQLQNSSILPDIELNPKGKLREIRLCMPACTDELFVETMLTTILTSVINPDMKLSNVLYPDEWALICRGGALIPNLYYETVLPACDIAVDVGGDNANVYDSRGLARARTGDTGGAIDDFTFAIEQAKQGGWDEATIATREAWLTELKAGKDPATIFDVVTLGSLR